MVAFMCQKITHIFLTLKNPMGVGAGAQDGPAARNLARSGPAVRIGDQSLLPGDKNILPSMPETV